MPFIDNLEEMTRALKDAEEERRLISQSVLEAISDAIFVVNEAGRIILINEAATLLTGYAANELLGKMVEELVPMERRERHMQERKEYRKEPTARPMGPHRQLLLLHKDGTQLRVIVGLNPVSGPRGGSTLAIVRPIVV